MKTIYRLSILLILIITANSCFTGKSLPGPSQVIAPLSDTTRIKEGTVIYTLPMTLFTINVEMERSIDIPGPYADYAEELLGLNDVIKNEEEHWSVKGISVFSHQEADPSEYYVIETTNPFNSNALALRKEGLILDINPQVQYAALNPNEDKSISLEEFRSYDLGSDEYYNIKADTVYRRVKVDNQFIRIPYIMETKKKLTESQLAERAARRLMDLRDGKLLILTGEANVFPQNEAAINEMNRMERDYTELFTGKTITEIRTFTYRFTPREDMSGKPVTLFRLSEVTGPEDAGSDAGIPVNVILEPEKKTREISLITRDQSDPLTLKIDKLYYRVPEVVDMTIEMGGEILYTSRKLIYQFGEILQLPANYIIGK